MHFLTQIQNRFKAIYNKGHAWNKSYKIKVNNYLESHNVRRITKLTIITVTEFDHKM